MFGDSAQVLEWESPGLRSFVINLDSRPDKWTKVHGDCLKKGIIAERFSAIGHEEAFERLGPVNLDGGNLGLNASFLAVVEQIDTLSDEWVLIFEDDVRFRRRFNLELLEDLLRSAPRETVLVQFGFLTGSEWRRDKRVVENLHRYVRPRARLRSALDRKRGVIVRSPTRFRAGTHALAVRPGAASTIRQMLEPYDRPLDHLVYDAMVKAPAVFMQTSRSLATQRAHRSDIASTRTTRS